MEEASRVQVFGPRPNLLPDALGRVVFANETTVFQDLVLQKRRRLSEDNQIDIPPKPAGQLRLDSQSFASGNCPFRDDRQVEIAAPATPACRRGSEQIGGRDPLLSPEYGGHVLHFSVLRLPFAGRRWLKAKRCRCDIGQELFDLFIRNRLNDKVHFFRIVHILKVTELFPEEFLVVIGAEKVF